MVMITGFLFNNFNAAITNLVEHFPLFVNSNKKIIDFQSKRDTFYNTLNSFMYGTDQFIIGIIQELIIGKHIYILNEQHIILFIVGSQIAQISL
jgi:hypothetical protein